MHNLYSTRSHKRRVFLGKISRAFWCGVALVFFLAVSAGVWKTWTSSKVKQNAQNRESGVENFNNGNFDQAIENLTKTKDATTDADTIMKIAASYYNKKEYEKAISYYEKLIALDSKNSAGYNGIANVYRDKKEEERAVEYYQKAIQANPEYILAYSNYAIMLSDSGKKEEAKAVIRGGLDRVPNSVELQNVQTYLANE